MVECYLNLATYSGTMTGGWSGPAIIAGDHQNSLLYQRIIQPIGTDGSMPPNDPLSQSQIDLIAQWIDEGAGNSLSTNDVFYLKSIFYIKITLILSILVQL